MERGGAIGGMGAIAASRRGGSGQAAASRIWDPSRYYLPTRDPTGTGDSSTGSPTGIGDILWAIPFTFDVDGVITDVLSSLATPTSGAGEAFNAIWGCDLSAPGQPTELKHAMRCDGGGAGAIYHDAGELVAVTAGDVLWFGASGTSGIDVYAGGAIVVGTDRPGFIVGYNFNPAAPATSGTGFRGIVGIKLARAYAWPPPDPFPTLAADDSDRIFNTATDLIPTFAFRFRPEGA